MSPGGAVVFDLLRGRRAVLTLASRSMLPLLREGDELLVVPRGAEALAPGQIAAFARDERLLVHRVVRRGPGALLVTRGDAASSIDHPVPPGSLLGQVVARRRPGRPWKRLDRGIYRLYGELLARLARPIAAAVPCLRGAFGRSGLLPLLGRRASIRALRRSCPSFRRGPRAGSRGERDGTRL